MMPEPSKIHDQSPATEAAAPWERIDPSSINALIFPTLSEMPLSPDGTVLGAEQVEIMLVELASSGAEKKMVALAFSSVTRLTEAMGEEQAWVAIPKEGVESALDGSGAEAILLDAVLDGEPRGDADDR